MLQKGQLVFSPENGGTRIFTIAGYLDDQWVEMQTGETLPANECIPVPVHYNKPEYVRWQPHLRGDVFGILCNEVSADKEMSEIMAEYEQMQDEVDSMWGDLLEGRNLETPQDKTDQT